MFRCGWTIIWVLSGDIWEKSAFRGERFAVESSFCDKVNLVKLDSLLKIKCRLLALGAGFTICVFSVKLVPKLYSAFYYLMIYC